MAGSINILNTYFPGRFSEQQLLSFEKLAVLTREWNQKINVISRKDTENIWVHHILHSLTVLKYFDFIKVKTILDVGTGGGFPGLPLAIALPEINFTLVDGRGKKIQVVQNMIKELGLAPQVKAHKMRSEEIHDKFNVVTGRAITDAKLFVESEKKRLASRGSILYWTGMAATASTRNVSIFKLEDNFTEEWFNGKCILQIRK